MSRHDDASRRQRRAHDDFQRGLARRDLAGALEALARLAPEERARVIDRALEPFRLEVSKLHERGEWSKLHALAVRADAVPELVTAGIPPDSRAVFTWPLVWAAGFARDFARAERLSRHLDPWLTEASPALAKALSLWISHAGNPPPDALPAPAVAPADPRLGAEPVRPRPTQRAVATPVIPPPTTAAAAPEAVLNLYATHPWTTFAEVVSSRWLPRATTEAGDALRATTLGVCLYDSLRRRAAGELEALRPLALAARCFAELKDKAPARDDAMLLLRVAMDGARAKLPTATAALEKVLEALAHDAELAPLAVDIACEMDAASLTIAEHVAFLGRIWKSRPAFALWHAALLRWSKEHTPDCEHEPPAWFGDAALAALTDDALSRLLLRDDAKGRDAVLEWLSFYAHAEEFDALVERLWDKAAPALRRTLARLVAEQVMDSGADLADLSAPTNMRDAMRMLNDLLSGGGLGARIPDASRARLKRHMPRMLGQHEVFLLTAVTACTSRAQVGELIERYAREGHPLELALGAVVLSSNDLPGARTHDLAPELCRVYADDLPTLARAYLWLEPKIDRGVALRSFGAALLDADEALPGERTPSEQAAIASAAKLLRRRRPKAKKPPKPKAPPKPRVKKAPAVEPSSAPPDGTAGHPPRPARKPRTKKPIVETPVRPEAPPPRRRG